MSPHLSLSARETEQFIQHHNRLTSFADWPLQWEQTREKPSPAAFARAGFYSRPAAPNLNDNVACPLCHIFLDKWEAGDLPLQIRKAQAPDCPFVRGYARARIQAPERPRTGGMRLRLAATQSWWEGAVIDRMKDKQRRRNMMKYGRK